MENHRSLGERDLEQQRADTIYDIRYTRHNKRLMQPNTRICEADPPDCGARVCLVCLVARATEHG